MTLARYGADVLTSHAAEVGECPLWDERDGVLYFCDLASDSIHRLRVATGEVASLTLALPAEHRVAGSAQLGSIGRRAGGGLVVAIGAGFAALDGWTPRLAWVVQTGQRPSDRHRMNDGKCDPAGRFWAGSRTADGSRRGGLYRLAPDRSVRRVLDGIGESNGLGWSPDGGRMYHVDTGTRTLVAYEFDLDLGRPGPGRPLVAVTDGLPDGLAVAADGCIWLAVWGAGQVRRYTPEGTLDAAVDVPATLVTSCAFGGDDLRTLFITTARDELSERQLAEQPLAGRVFAARLPTPGLPVTAFAG